MSVLTGEIIEKLLELVGPYINDLKMVSDWLKSHTDKDIKIVRNELERRCSEAKPSTTLTDLRILKNAFERLEL